MRNSAAKNGSSPTIVDVARESGLSTATVSRVFTPPNGSSRVREVTRDRVLRVAEELGYHPHWFARALAKGSSNAIGLLFEGDTPSLGSVHQGMISRFTDKLHRNGYRLLFIPVSENDSSWHQMLLGGHLDACVCIGSVHPAVQRALRESEMPAVVLNCDTECGRPRVLVDDREGAERFTKYLIDLGHRDIVFFTSKEAEATHYSVPERKVGFLAAVRKAGVRARIVNCTADELVRNELDGPDAPTGVVAYSHLESISLLHSLWRAGKRVPDDVSLISFNELFPVAQTMPPLTTMSVMSHRVGWIGAAVLLRQLRTGKVMGNEVYRVKEKLVLRESATTCLPAQ